MIEREILSCNLPMLFCFQNSLLRDWVGHVKPGKKIILSNVQQLNAMSIVKTIIGWSIYPATIHENTNVNIMGKSNALHVWHFVKCQKYTFSCPWSSTFNLKFNICGSFSCACIHQRPPLYSVVFHFWLVHSNIRNQ